MGRAFRSIATCAVVLSALGLFPSCQFLENPVRAGHKGDTSIRLNHTIDFIGRKHADGYCQPADNCSACHGASLQGGTHSEPSCTQCHGQLWTKSYCGSGLAFHSLNLGGQMHGPNPCSPQGVCTDCHGAGLQGGSNGEPSCTQCHGPIWTAPNCGTALHTVNLGGQLHGPGYCNPALNCSGCHGAALQGGTHGEPSCTKCHGALWTNPGCGQNPHTVAIAGIFHAPNFCQPQQSCSGCHGSNLQGGSGTPSCTSCHGVFWTSPGCGQNLHVNSFGGHFHASNFCRPYQNCQTCHGTNLHGGTTGAPSCLQCHNQVQWKNCGSTQHTVNHNGTLHAGGAGNPTANCAPCHGADLRGGFNSEPSCYRCHGAVWGGGIIARQKN